MLKCRLRLCWLFLPHCSLTARAAVALRACTVSVAPTSPVVLTSNLRVMHRPHLTLLASTLFLLSCRLRFTSTLSAVISHRLPSAMTYPMMQPSIRVKIDHV